MKNEVRNPKKILNKTRHRSKEMYIFSLREKKIALNCLKTLDFGRKKSVDVCL